MLLSEAHFERIPISIAQCEPRVTSLGTKCSFACESKYVTSGITTSACEPDPGKPTASVPIPSIACTEPDRCAIAPNLPDQTARMIPPH